MVYVPQFLMFPTLGKLGAESRRAPYTFTRVGYTAAVS